MAHDFGGAFAGGGTGVGSLGTGVTFDDVEIAVELVELGRRSYYYHGARRVAMREGREVYYLHADHLGSTSLTTGGTGQAVVRQLYHPYGTVRWSDGTLPTDFTFTGQRIQPGLGLVFMHARYYHPSLGRFISADTIVPDPGDPQAYNRYGYARSSPLVYVDPTGHEECVPGQCDFSKVYSPMGAMYDNYAETWNSLGVSKAQFLGAYEEAVSYVDANESEYEGGFRTQSIVNRMAETLCAGGVCDAEETRVVLTMLGNSRAFKKAAMREEMLRWQQLAQVMEQLLLPLVFADISSFHHQSVGGTAGQDVLTKGFHFEWDDTEISLIPRDGELRFYYQNGIEVDASTSRKMRAWIWDTREQAAKIAQGIISTHYHDALQNEGWKRRVIEAADILRILGYRTN